MVNLALLFRPSTTPLEMSFPAPEVVEDQLPVLAKGTGDLLHGSIRQPMVWRRHSSRNLAAQAGEL
jgi:hypothetical protein